MGFLQLIKSLGRGINGIIPKNRNKIMFESNSDFCDNSRAVYDYMKKNHGGQYKFVWCVAVPQNYENTGNTEYTSFKDKRYFLHYIYHILTAGTVFYSHFVPPFCSPKSQNVINLWHGTPLKTLSGHVHSAELFSKVLTPSAMFDEVIEDSFCATKSQLLSVGYPRCDLLFDDVDTLTPLGIDNGDYNKVILWMPTFRKAASGDYTDGVLTDTGLPLVSTMVEIDQLNHVLMECNCFLIIKLHPGQSLNGVDMVQKSNIKMLVNKELDDHQIQLYHLVSNADVLLTDYSSIYFDYLLLNRPIGFIIDDIDNYMGNRGFVVKNPLELMPGVHIKTVDELNAFIKDVSGEQDGFDAQRKEVLALTNRYTDNNSCKRLLEELKIGSV